MFEWVVFWNSFKLFLDSRDCSRCGRPRTVRGTLVPGTSSWKAHWQSSRTGHNWIWFSKREWFWNWWNSAGDWWLVDLTFDLSWPRLWSNQWMTFSIDTSGYTSGHYVMRWVTNKVLTWRANSPDFVMRKFISTIDFDQIFWFRLRKI